MALEQSRSASSYLKLGSGLAFTDRVDLVDEPSLLQFEIRSSSIGVPSRVLRILQDGRSVVSYPASAEVHSIIISVDPPIASDHLPFLKLAFPCGV